MTSRAKRTRSTGTRRSTRRSDLASLISVLQAFASERDWGKFHSPKNLAMALSVEVGELMEHFQWLTERESFQVGCAERSEIAEETADVQIYLLMLADKLRIDLVRAVEEKIEKNRTRYPVDQVRGVAKKARRSAPR
jgi:NTP pyrophosphatase (non-canonical NTP hydrolase)